MYFLFIYIHLDQFLYKEGLPEANALTHPLVYIFFLAEFLSAL